jgi:hypothetical protein
VLCSLQPMLLLTAPKVRQLLRAAPSLGLTGGLAASVSPGSGSAALGYALDACPKSPIDCLWPSSYGVLLASISCVASASKPVLALLLMKGAATIPPLTVLWYDSFFSFTVMIAIWSVSGERDASIVYMQEHRSTGLLVVLVGSFVAFLYNLSTFYLTFFTSGLTINIIANTKQVLMIIFSAIVVEHVTSVLSWTGVAIFAAALGTYTYLTIGPSKASHQWLAEEQPAPVANGKVGAAETIGPKGGSQAPASESTPMLKAGGT